MNTKISASIKVGQEILAELTKTANLLSNGCEGDKEKTLSVGFKASIGNRTDLVADLSKFTAEDGSLVINDKALSEEKGRILTRQELLKTTTQHERMTLNGFSDESTELATPEIKTIFNGVSSKNAIDSVREKWSGFAPEIESFKDSIGQEISVSKESNMEEKVESIIEKWALPNSHIDFGDTGLDEHFEDFEKILNHVAEEFKKPVEGNERLKISKRIYDEIASRITEVEDETPETPEGEGETPEGEGETPEGEGEGKTPEGEGEGKTPEGKKPEGKKPLRDSKNIGERIVERPDNSEFPQGFQDLKADNDTPKDFPSSAEDYDPAKIKVRVHKFKPTNSDKETYRGFMVTNRRMIESIKQSFAFKSVHLSRPNFGKTVGDLDTNGLHKFHMGEKIRLFEEKEIPKGKRYTIGILLDQSGSMGGNKIKDASTVCLALVEAIKSIKGIDLVVYGHSADRGEGNTLEMFPYYQRGLDNTIGLANAKALSNNADGFAIRFISERMLETNPANANSVHHLFVISDGQPAALCYAGKNGISHTAKCVKQAIERNINVFGIGIQSAFDNGVGTSLYGTGNYVILKDTISSLPLLCREIKKLITS